MTVLRWALCAMLIGAPAGPSRAFGWEDVDFDKATSGGTHLFQAAKGMTDDEEIKLGREVAANLAARYGFVDEASKVDYMNLVGGVLASHCDRPKIPYHFAILRTPEINALSAPGGYVFVTQGLLDQLADESELAGVLAHEISHIVQRHVVKAIRKANVLGAGTDLASASGHSVDDYAKLTDFTAELMNNGFSRGDELEADRLGTLLAARAGYDPTGLRRCVERLGKNEQTSALLAHFSKTHPPVSDRLKVLDQTLDHNKLKAEGPRLPERYRSAFPLTKTS